MKENMRKTFVKQFNKKPEKIYFSPGRVNIIGGHTDYNGGAVLPFCINLGIYGAIAFRSDSLVNVFSKNFSRLGNISFDIRNVSDTKDLGFVNYIIGTLIIYKEAGYNVDTGFDLAIYGNLPKGGGLSSSASLLVLIGKMINNHFDFKISNPDIARLARKVENQYIGIQCGIMDQYIIANGLKDKALYLNTNTMEYEHIPCKLDDYKFVLVNSRTTRKLVESNYNTRQQESQKVLSILKNYVDIENVCDLLPEDYDKYEGHIQDQELKNRFKHLVDEHNRVVLAKSALQKNDFESLAKLLTQAHYSARDLYKVSSETLDDLVEMSLASGSLGSKMIGGGFGGSTLSLVRNSDLDRFLDDFTERYIREYNMAPIINIVYPTNSTGELK